MKKVFISQPMNGRSDKDIKEERENILRMVSEKLGEEVEEIQSFIPLRFRERDYKVPGLAYLGESLKMLANADVAVFAKGHENARGCRVEHHAAEAYGIDIMYA